jgi:4-hydroxyphenylacetate decarboxylase small subunit
MKNKAPCHQDCREYIPVDVFQGMCRVKKDVAIPDAEACELFCPVKKCRHCSSYHESEDETGTCRGKNPAYPDMIAKTCENFEWDVAPDER